MNSMRKMLLATALGAGVLGLSVASAPAAIVCSGHFCWHTHEAFDYPPAAGVVVHPDDWRWGAREHFAWREHEGRGYWRGGRWVAW